MMGDQKQANGTGQKMLKEVWQKGAQEACEHRTQKAACE